MTAFTTSTHHLTDPQIGAVDMTVAEAGAGFPFVLLHGGGGPRSMHAFAEILADVPGARVIAPTHPGFDGTVRPAGLDSVRRLAQAYGALFDDLDLSGVTVIGNSLGGWIAAELALSGSDRIGRVVLVDAGGIDVPGIRPVDFFSLDMAQVADLSYSDPDKYRIDITTVPAAAQQVMASNRAALAAYGGPTVSDPSLLARLSDVKLPVLVVWGEADRMYTPEYGCAYAKAIPGAEYELLAGAGHLPQVETPRLLLETVTSFIQGHLGADD